MPIHRHCVVPCPAKLNLFLSVGPPDSRRYHPLRTIFQAISLFDSLEIELADVDSFVCNEPEVPSANSVVRTLRLMREIVDVPPLRISLVKRIPMQSGLGGGSSDAAGMIRGISAMFGLSLPEAEQMGIAIAVGADVPFFLVGGRAKGEGYGEVLTPFHDGEPSWFVVAKPGVGCDTTAAFAKLDSLERTWREFPAGAETFNDFEEVAPEQSLELIARLRSLGADSAALSGSGSAVFGRFPSKDDADRANLEMGQFAKSWSLQGLRRSESLQVDLMAARQG